MNLTEKIKNLPLSPGVYLMKDSLGGIIYVGKAKNLKNRVQSYFRKSKNHSPKIKKLIQHLKDFDYILTDTEFEAFMLECKLIKEIKPPYNRKMKNPLSFIYIRIHIRSEIPKIETANFPIKNDGNLYFGPYTNKNTVERVLQGIKECFKILCSNTSKKGTPCLNYSLGLCIGICAGGSAVETYKNIIYKIVALLNGTDMILLEEMKQMMLDASEKFDFETAGKIRDCIGDIVPLINKEEVIEFTEDNKNIVIIEYLNDHTCKLFLIKRTEVLFSEKHLLKSLDIKQLRLMITKNLFSCFEAKVDETRKEISRNEIDEAQIIYSYLKSNNCSYIIVPQKWLDHEYNDKIDEALNQLLSCQNQMINQIAES